MAAFYFPLISLLLFGLQGCGDARQVPSPMVLLELLAGCFFAECLIEAEMESFEVTVWLCVWAVLVFQFLWCAAAL